MRHDALALSAGKFVPRAAARAPTAASALVGAALALSLVGCNPATSGTTESHAARPDMPSIRLVTGDGEEKSAAFEVANLPSDGLARLATVDWDAAQWHALLAVYVSKDCEATCPRSFDAPVIADQPPVLGTHRVVGAALRFESQYPLQPGLAYDVVLDVSRLPGQNAAGDVAPTESVPLVQRFALPKPAGGLRTVVEAVYPTADVLPENLLKFYLHFSAPMSRGEAYRRIHLLDSAGQEIKFPFLELDEELWDPEGARFTLFFDPGRIKRGLVPHAELGLALSEGNAYTLVIDSDWLDASGRPLGEEFRRTFRVAAPDDQPPSLESWRIDAPRAGTREPVKVSFPEPLDHALLLRQVRIENQAGQAVPAAMATINAEAGWQFTPEAAWSAGTYRLVVDTTLEDLAGNSIGRPFEVDVFHPVERRVESKTVAREFEVGAGDGAK